MTQDELLALGCNRFRRSIWADPTDYVRVDVFDGHRGPWMHVWARRSQEICGMPTPQNILNIEEDATDDYEPYTGPLDPADMKA